MPQWTLRPQSHAQRLAAVTLRSLPHSSYPANLLSKLLCIGTGQGYVNPFPCKLRSFFFGFFVVFLCAGRWTDCEVFKVVLTGPGFGLPRLFSPASLLVGWFVPGRRGSYRSPRPGSVPARLGPWWGGCVFLPVCLLHPLRLAWSK